MLKGHSERILDQGSVNFLMLERWMGEIIEMESDSIAHFSKLVRNSVDALIRGEALSALEFSFTQPIKDTELSPTVLDSRGTDVTNSPLLIPPERLSNVVRALREAATPEGKNPLSAGHTIPLSKFVETISLLANTDSLTQEWKQLSSGAVKQNCIGFGPR